MVRSKRGHGGATWFGNLGVILLFGTILFAFGYCLPVLMAAGPSGPAGGPDPVAGGTAPGGGEPLAPSGGTQQPAGGAQPPAGGTGTPPASEGSAGINVPASTAPATQPAPATQAAPTTQPAPAGTTPPATSPTSPTPGESEPAVFGLVLTPPVASDFSEESVTGDAHAWQDEVMEIVGRRALAAGLIVVNEEQAGDGSGEVVYTSTVVDQDALDTLTAQVIAELAHGQGEAATLSPGGWVCAVMLDRMLNHGIVDPEAAVDVVPPFITPSSPLPDSTVRTRRPIISVSFQDRSPSAGLDPTSLVVRLDGQLLPIFLPDGASSFSEAVPFDLAPGRHKLVVEIRDLVGQKRTAEWWFTVAP